MNETETKKPYIKPETKIIELKLDQPILTGSAPNFGNGGYWG